MRWMGIEHKFASLVEPVLGEKASHQSFRPAPLDHGESAIRAMPRRKPIGMIDGSGTLAMHSSIVSVPGMSAPVMAQRGLLPRDQVLLTATTFRTSPGRQTAGWGWRAGCLWLRSTLPAPRP